MRGRSFFNIHVLRDCLGRLSKNLHFDKNFDWWRFSDQGFETIPILGIFIPLSPDSPRIISCRGIGISNPYYFFHLSFSSFKSWKFFSIFDLLGQFFGYWLKNSCEKWQIHQSWEHYLTSVFLSMIIQIMYGAYGKESGQCIRSGHYVVKIHQCEVL